MGIQILSDAELEARNCLKLGDVLIDPKYQYPSEKYEELLKVQCKRCWALREFFPKWVMDYVTKWSAEKVNAHG